MDIATKVLVACS